MYLIEPLAGAEAGEQGDGETSEVHSSEGLHAVYNYKHLRRKRSSCSHGNTTTFYDHGARPSGLFQLSSLVKTLNMVTYSVWRLQLMYLDCWQFCASDAVPASDLWYKNTFSVIAWKCIKMRDKTLFDNVIFGGFHIKFPFSLMIWDERTCVNYGHGLKLDQRLRAIIGQCFCSWINSYWPQYGNVFYTF